MECMAQEPVLFVDILCQMVDMITPEVRKHFLAESKISFLCNSLMEGV